MTGHRARMKVRGSTVFLRVLTGVLLVWGVAIAGAAQEDTTPEESPQYVGSEECGGCHEQYDDFPKTPHFATTDTTKYAPARRGCEACHGPGSVHIEELGEAGTIFGFSTEAAQERTDICLRCHDKQEERINFRRSEHNMSQISCDVCHSPHRAGLTGDIINGGNVAELCYQCHGEVRNSFSLPFHHKIPEGQMTCVDCHNQHGGFNEQKRLFGTDMGCLRCHSDKQGPFTFEHISVLVEGCTVCHTQHGATNPRLLSRSEVHLLCLECHADTPVIPFVQGTPQFHDINQVRFRNCTSCHVQIHGSNLSPLFFE